MEDKSINEKALEDLSRVYGGLDYIFFINVNSDDKKYWLRCYDTGKKEFIWMESASVADDNPELSCAQTAWSITGKFSIQTK